jgi:lipid II:glycine glycyltransferase (peptidoglycan interpeptide bridge formation enzyme)
MEYGIVLVATYENKPIAASIFFQLVYKAIYKYAASDKKYLCLRPNNLIMWEAIKWYARNGFSTISLGRTEPANFGLRRFKSSWGAIENTLSYYRYDMRKEIFVRSHSLKCGLLSRVFQRTPGFLLRFIGSIAYKHIG